MIDPIRFLNAFGKSLSAMALYAPTHPARAKSAQLAFEAVQEMQKSELVLKFSFLGDEIVFQNRTVRELQRLGVVGALHQVGHAAAGVREPVIKEEFEDFLYTIMAEVTPGWRDPRHTQRTEGSEYTSIRYGAIGVRGDSDQFLTDPLPVIGMNFPLDEEAETIGMIYGEVEAGRPLPAGEIETVVASLSVAMHGDSEILMPLLQLKEFDQYTTAHALNVSVLVMGLSEFLGLGGRDTRAIGVAGLLRDVGNDEGAEGDRVEGGPAHRRGVGRDPPASDRGRADHSHERAAARRGGGGGVRAPHAAGRAGISAAALRARVPLREQARAGVRLLRRAAHAALSPWRVDAGERAALRGGQGGHGVRRGDREGVRDDDAAVGAADHPVGGGAAGAGRVPPGGAWPGAGACVADDAEGNSDRHLT